MALDRYVYWQAKTPTRGEIVCVLEDYVRGLAEVAVMEGDALCVTLPGTLTRALRRVAARRMDDDEGNDRWFEVCFGDDHIDVITRQTDEVTNAIAEGFAALVARHYGARRG